MALVSSKRRWNPIAQDNRVMVKMLCKEGVEVVSKVQKLAKQETTATNGYFTPCTPLPSQWFASGLVGPLLHFPLAPWRAFGEGSVWNLFGSPFAFVLSKISAQCKAWQSNSPASLLYRLITTTQHNKPQHEAQPLSQWNGAGLVFGNHPTVVDGLRVHGLSSPWTACIGRANGHCWGTGGANPRIRYCFSMMQRRGRG